MQVQPDRPRRHLVVTYVFFATRKTIESKSRTRVAAKTESGWLTAMHAFKHILPETGVPLVLDGQQVLRGQLGERSLVEMAQFCWRQRIRSTTHTSDVSGAATVGAVQRYLLSKPL